MSHKRNVSGSSLLLPQVSLATGLGRHPSPTKRERPDAASSDTTTFDLLSPSNVGVLSGSSPVSLLPTGIPVFTTPRKAIGLSRTASVGAIPAPSNKGGRVGMGTISSPASAWDGPGVLRTPKAADHDREDESPERLATKRGSLMALMSPNGKEDRQGETVKVVVRIRPLIFDDGRGSVEPAANEEESGSVKEGQLQTLGNQIIVQGKPFNFDKVYTGTSRQEDIFNESVKGVVDQTLLGFNGTVMAYGQTSSGKTHTIMGDITDPDAMGITPRVIEHLFRSVSETQQVQPQLRFLFMVSYLEVYNEKVRDLLAPINSKDTAETLQVRENLDHSFVVPDLSKHLATSRANMHALIRQGSKRRQTTATVRNATSSRSHSMVTLYIESNDGSQVTAAKLNLLDLAGSERYEDVSDNAARGEESLNINKSLSCLAKVIAALTSSSSTHVPYRESKLTRLLKDSLGGNSKTLLVACLHPGTDSLYIRETLNTLRYASRAKRIKNSPKINQNVLGQTMSSLLEELAATKDILAHKNAIQDHLFAIVAKLLQVCEKKHMSIAASPSKGRSASVDMLSPEDPWACFVEHLDKLERIMKSNPPVSSLGLDEKDNQELTEALSVLKSQEDDEQLQDFVKNVEGVADIVQASAVKLLQNQVRERDFRERKALLINHVSKMKSTPNVSRFDPQKEQKPALAGVGQTERESKLQQQLGQAVEQEELLRQEVAENNAMIHRLVSSLLALSGQSSKAAATYAADESAINELIADIKSKQHRLLRLVSCLQAERMEIEAATQSKKTALVQRISALKEDRETLIRDNAALRECLSGLMGLRKDPQADIELSGTPHVLG